eukprot:jgi/Astpho2/4016/fgenesh1_pg.00063_%23_53_t
MSAPKTPSLIQAMKEKVAEFQQKRLSDPGDSTKVSSKASPDKMRASPDKLRDASPLQGKTALEQPASTPIIRAQSQELAFISNRQAEALNAAADALSTRTRLALCAAAAALLLFSHWRFIWALLKSGSTLLADLLALACLLLAASVQVKQWVIAPTKRHANAVSEAVSTLPRMSDCITKMLIEIRSMREDLHSLKAKASWLPGN